MNTQILIRKISLLVKVALACWLTLGSSSITHGQVYTVDQTDSAAVEDGISVPAAAVQQSFTPSLGSIGYIRLACKDDPFGNGKGSSLFANLRASLDGPIIGKTSTVTIPDNFLGDVVLLFPTNITLVTNQLYFFEPVPQGDSIIISRSHGSTYVNGSEFVNGKATVRDLFFAEGVVQGQLGVPVRAANLLTINSLGAGILEYAASPTGPWNTLSNQTNGTATVNITTNVMLFFRSRR